MAEEPGTKLREEATYDSLRGIEAVSWEVATNRFESWYDDQRDTKVVVENSKGEQTGFRTPNRFTPEYRAIALSRTASLDIRE